MRTIEEIKADIEYLKESDMDNTVIMDCMKELLKYRELERDGRCVVLPCKIRDTVYTNFAMRGWYLKSKDRPYAVEVVFIGINDSEEMGYGFMNVKYKKDFMFPVNFSDIGKTVFLTKEAAEKAWKGGA